VTTASGIPIAATLKSIKTAKDGYKDGEISMFNKEGVAFAYKWSTRKDMWEEVGEVAGTAPGKALGGTPGKTSGDVGGGGSEAVGEGGEAGGDDGGEAKPELSMEERKAAMEARILKAKVEKKAAADAENKELEKKRRAMGKESIDAKEAREKLTRENDMAERKRAKQADIEHRKKLVLKIAAEKEARKRKADGLPPAEEKAPPAAPAAPKPAGAKKVHTSCVLMVKTLDGGSEKISFKPDDTVGTVHNHVGMLHMRGEQDGWVLASMFPRELYTPDKHGITLKEAGLVPKAQLVITKT